MRFRFTLSHDVLGSQVISEPDGFDGAKIKWERHPDFFSLIEYYEGAANGAFIFYGANVTEGIDGGIDFIRSVETTYGFDADIEILIEYSHDDVTYATLFSGLLDLSEKVEMPDNRMQVPVIRDDFWSKFINRYETRVDLSSLVDLDGNAVDAVPTINCRMDGPTIRYNGEYRWDESETYPDDGGATAKFYQLDFDGEVTDDLKKFNLPRTTVSSSIADLGRGLAGQFEAPWDGTYTFDVKVVTADLSTGPQWVANASQVEIKIGKAGLEHTEHDTFSESAVGPYGVNADTLLIATYNGSFELKKGEQIVIYAKDILGGASSGFDRTFFGETRWTYRTDCVVATTANIVLSGEQTIDGVLTSTDRVLVKNQGDATQNGIYVSAAGAWSRATDANTAAELNSIAVYVTSGTTNADTAWKQVNTISTLGTDEVEWKFLVPSDERLLAYPALADPVESYCIVTADTTFEETDVPGYLIHDLIHGTLARLGLGTNPFYSEFLGHSANTVNTYADDGCGWMYFICKGLQLRGYTLSEKPFFTSMKEIWDGINPILNLGLGYETIASVQKIRIEQKDEWVGNTAPVNFSNVRDITATYDKDYIFKTISTGYKKWQAEEISGDDIPQSKHNYATRFVKTGTDKNLESDFIASDIALGVTLRKKNEKSDYKYDNDIFIVALNTDDVSPDLYIPELDEAFASVTNLNNSTTRYNLLLTPMRNLLRWGPYLSGCLQSYLSSNFKFVSGEGNYDMVSDANIEITCNRAVNVTSLAESDDISPNGLGFYFLPILYEIKIPMEKEDFDLINRKQPIGISQSDTGHTDFHIKEIEYDIIKGEAVIKAWPETFFNITVPVQTITMLECAPDVAAVVYDVDYQAVLDYAELQGWSVPSNAQKLIESNKLADMKTEGVWDTLDLFYHFETNGDENFAKINWKNPGTHQLAESGTVTFTSLEGFTGDGSTGYLDTGWNPNDDGVNFTLDECGAFIKINNTVTPGNVYQFGGHRASQQSVQLAVKVSTTQCRYALNCTSILGSNTGDSDGFYHVRRVADNDIKVFKNAVELNTSTQASDSLSDLGISIVLLALNSNGTVAGFSDAQIGCFGIGASQTGKESALNTIFNS